MLVVLVVRLEIKSMTTRTANTEKPTPTSIRPDIHTALAHYRRDGRVLGLLVRYEKYFVDIM